jgi:hypothetical protein
MATLAAYGVLATCLGFVAAIIAAAEDSPTLFWLILFGFWLPIVIGPASPLPAGSWSVTAKKLRSRPDGVVGALVLGLWAAAGVALDWSFRDSLTTYVICFVGLLLIGPVCRNPRQLSQVHAALRRRWPNKTRLTSDSATSTEISRTFTSQRATDEMLAGGNDLLIVTEFKANPENQAR